MDISWYLCGHFVSFWLGTCLRTSSPIICPWKSIKIQQKLGMRIGIITCRRYRYHTLKIWKNLSLHNVTIIMIMRSTEKLKKTQTLLANEIYAAYLPTSELQVRHWKVRRWIVHRWIVRRWIARHWNVQCWNIHYWIVNKRGVYSSNIYHWNYCHWNVRC